MYDPKLFKHIMSKRVEMKNAGTGRKITVAIDLSIDEMRIDGVLVERKPDMEKIPAELVFGAPYCLRDHTYIIERERLNRIRKIWGMPEV